MAELLVVQEGYKYRPTVSSNIGRVNSSEFIFTEQMFTKDFFDPLQGTYSIVTLKTLPSVPLMYKGLPAVVGTEFYASEAFDLKFILSDQYSIHNGVLYKFTDTLANIIAEQEALGRKLVNNVNGILDFVNPDNEADKARISGQAIPRESLAFSFTVRANPSNLDTKPATFSLIPWENVNVRENLYGLGHKLTPDDGSITIDENKNIRVNVVEWTLVDQLNSQLTF